VKEITRLCECAVIPEEIRSQEPVFDCPLSRGMLALVRREFLADETRSVTKREAPLAPQIGNGIARGQAAKAVKYVLFDIHRE
jgi:hypothetical protein